MKNIIWDEPTRIIHWVIATAITLNLFWLEDDPHQWVGYLATAFVIARLALGLVPRTFLPPGALSEASHFSNFPIRPRDVKEFVGKFFSNTEPMYPGHNPLASYIYFGIWLLILSLGVTGWMMGLDRFWGEEWLEEIHETIATGLQVLIVFHFAGIITDAIKYRRKTWLAMLTGKRN